MQRDKRTEDVAFHHLLISHELGGAGIIALRIAEFVNQRTPHTHLWIPGPGPAWLKAMELNLAVHQYDAASALAAHRFSAISANWSIGRKLRQMGPGVVHVHNPLYYGALRLGLKLSSLKCIAHVHLEEDEQSLQWAFKYPPDLIITCAQYLVAHVRKSLPEPYREKQKIVAVPNAVDTQRFGPADKRQAKARIGMPSDLPVVLMLANLAPHKGHETAICAISLLKKHGVRVHCWIAGIEREKEKNYTVRLRSLVQALSLGDEVHFLGQRDDAPELLRAADVFLLPSTAEGLPLSILEAQATKVPVLAAPTAGIPEVVKHGKTGLLIPAGDAEGYAAGISQLLENSELYHSMAEAAYDHVTREYHWESLCERVWELYQELLESSAY